MAKAKDYNAIDLLDKVLEFVEMTPNKNKWNLSALKSNPPRQIRLRQIEALINAFDITFNESDLTEDLNSSGSNKPIPAVQLFLSGKFIESRQPTDYTLTINYIKDFVKSRSAYYNETREFYFDELVDIFSKLVDYKRQLREILTFNSRYILANSTSAQFTIHLTDSISENLIDKYSTLDHALTLLINPKELTFTEDVLIDQFNYPTENLAKIDIEFM